MGDCISKRFRVYLFFVLIIKIIEEDVFLSYGVIPLFKENDSIVIIFLLIENFFDYLDCNRKKYLSNFKVN